MKDKNRIETSTTGEWGVYDDSLDPIAQDISFEEMKSIVDGLAQQGNGEVYGENDVTDEWYEGPGPSGGVK